MDNATIVAIATPPGIGALGIVRMSGSEAAQIAALVFHRGAARVPVDLQQIPSHRLLFGAISDPLTGCEIDEVLLSWMRAPNSYTSQDTVEFTCHGGAIALQETLRVLLVAGARSAEPGEFTRRAWLNGKIDLTQAEAVHQIVTARTAESLRLALTELGGDLTRRIAPAQQAVIDLLAYLDAAADFPDDEIPRIDVDQEIACALETLQQVVAGGQQGMVYRDGVQVALVGRPNVGKSSLLNALLRSERAIVTPIAGTTRDVIAETITIQGVPVTLLDTAGMMDSADLVEQLGVERSERAIAAATALVLVLDQSVAPTTEDAAVVQRIVERSATLRDTPLPLVIAMNKSDLQTAGDFSGLLSDLPSHQVVNVSAQSGTGLPTLETAILAVVQGDTSEVRPALLTVRQQAALERALTHLLQAAESRRSGFAIDLMATDVRAALRAIGSVTGEDVDAAVLSEIFGRFCIGK